MFGFSAFAAAPFASLGGINAEIAVTGVQGSGAVGTVTFKVDDSVLVTGVEGTGEVGTVTISTT